MRFSASVPNCMGEVLILLAEGLDWNREALSYEARPVDWTLRDDRRYWNGYTQEDLRKLWEQ